MPVCRGNEGTDPKKTAFGTQDVTVTAAPNATTKIAKLNLPSNFKVNYENQFDFDGDAKGFTYMLKSDGTIKITGVDEAMVQEWEEEYEGVELNIPSTLFGLPVTEIGDRAFYSDAYYEKYEVWLFLSKVTIPSSIIKIGEGAFAENDIEMLVLNEGLEEIGPGAFAWQVGLTEVTIPSTVKTIGDAAFMDCYGLTTVTFMGAKPSTTPLSKATLIEFDEPLGSRVDVFHWDNNAYGIYPAGNTTWSGVSEYQNLQMVASGASAPTGFNYKIAKGKATIRGYYGEGRGDLVIPDVVEGTSIPVTEIGGWAFESPYCEFTSVKLGKNIEKIGEEAFDSHATIQSLDLRTDKELTIGEDAFWACGATSLTIPAHVKKLGAGAFGVMPNLKKVIFEGMPPAVFGFENDPEFGRLVFEPGYQNTAIGFYSFLNQTEWVKALDADGKWQGLKMECAEKDPNAEPFDISPDKKNNTITIKGCAKGSTPAENTKLTIPETMYGLPVVAITDGAFGAVDDDGQLNLASVTFPVSLKKIGNYAFNNTQIATITFNDGLESIGAGAFAWYAGAQEEITIPASVKAIGVGAFAQCHGLIKVNFLGAPPTTIIPLDRNSKFNKWFAEDKVTTVFGLSGWTYGVYPVEQAVAWKKVIGKDGRWQGIQMVDSDHADSLKGQLNYKVENKGATILGFYGSIQGNYAIPAELGGYPVKKIANSALGQHWEMTSVTIPDTVTEVGFAAFEGCSLETIDLGCGVQSIGEDAFGGHQVTTLTIPASVTYLGSGAFRYYEHDTDRKLASVTFLGKPPKTAIGTDVEQVFDNTDSNAVGYYSSYYKMVWEKVLKGNNTWQNLQMCEKEEPLIIKGNKVVGCNPSLFEYDDAGSIVVTIPASAGGKAVTTIGANVFKDVDSPVTVVLSSAITKIEAGVFANPYVTIKIDPANKTLKLGEDGVIYDARMTKVICVPGYVTEWNIPNSVTSAEKTAFGTQSVSVTAAPNAATKIAKLNLPSNFKVTYKNQFELGAVAMDKEDEESFFDPKLAIEAIDLSEITDNGYTITAITGLPAGLTWDKKTNTIKGAPTKADSSYQVLFTAKDSNGNVVYASTTYNVAATPSLYIEKNPYSRAETQGLPDYSVIQNEKVAVPLGLSGASPYLIPMVRFDPKKNRSDAPLNIDSSKAINTILTVALEKGSKLPAGLSITYDKTVGDYVISGTCKTLTDDPATVTLKITDKASGYFGTIEVALEVIPGFMDNRIFEFKDENVSIDSIAGKSYTISGKIDRTGKTLQAAITVAGNGVKETEELTLLAAKYVSAHFYTENYVSPNGIQLTLIGSDYSEIPVCEIHLSIPELYSEIFEDIPSGAQ